MILEDNQDQTLDEETSALMESLRDDIQRMMSKDRTFLINPQKAKIVQRAYDKICKILADCEADYTVEVVKGVGPNTHVTILVLTDILEIPKKKIAEYQSIFDEVDELVQNVYKDKMSIKIGIKNVFFDVTEIEADA